MNNEIVAVNEDPTLPTQEVKIGGKTYTLCFDLRSLARAERELRAAGNDVNLFYALPGRTLDNILTLFACSIRRFHPEIGYDDACALLTPLDVYTVGDAINKLWEESVPKPDDEELEATNKAGADPTQPGT